MRPGLALLVVLLLIGAFAPAGAAALAGEAAPAPSAALPAASMSSHGDEAPVPGGAPADDLDDEDDDDGEDAVCSNLSLPSPGAPRPLALAPVRGTPRSLRAGSIFRPPRAASI